MLLCRRMEQFLGLHYTEDTIENGIDRLSIIRPPFTKSNAASMNRKMLALSQKRNELKDRWMRSLAVYDKMELNKIAARWPAKAVAQLSFSQ